MDRALSQGEERIPKGREGMPEQAIAGLGGRYLCNTLAWERSTCTADEGDGEQKVIQST